MDIIQTIYLLIRAFLVPRLVLAAENLALRQQVAVYKHTIKRPKLRTRDRIFWAWLSRLWPSPGHRPARNGHPLAPARLQALLEMEVEGQKTRPASRQTRNS